MFQDLYVVAELNAKAGQEDALRSELMKMVEATRHEDGFIQYDLHESTEHPGHFVFYEIWKSKAHLDRHSASPHLTAFGAVKDNLLAEPPRVLTYTRIA